MSGRRGLTSTTASQWRVVGEELLVVLVVVALSAQLIDRGDDVFWSATTELPNPQTFLPIVVAAVAVVTAGGRSRSSLRRGNRAWAKAPESNAAGLGCVDVGSRGYTSATSKGNRACLLKVYVYAYTRTSLN